METDISPTKAELAMMGLGPVYLKGLAILCVPNSLASKSFIKEYFLFEGSLEMLLGVKALGLSQV